MRKVKVIKKVCIAYSGKTHFQGDVFNVDEHHYKSFKNQGIIEDFSEVEEIYDPVEVVEKPVKKSRKKK